MSLSKLSITEEIDFAYLLELMPALHNIPQYSWLPELFAVIGYKRLIDLCEYAGGATITIPKIDDLRDSVIALQWFYNIHIKQKSSISEVPKKYKKLYDKICEAYEKC